MGRTLVLLTVLALGVTLAGQQPPAAPQEDQALPRFRAGASLVRVDAYVSLNGTPITDLAMDDFEVFEDDTAQKVETLELIRAREARGDTTTGPATPASTQEQRAAAQDPNARVFVLYLDRWHVGTDGSSRSAAPVEAFLDKVVGPNDLVGVMTPDITPQNMTLVRKGNGIDRVLRDVWYWGERDRLNTSDPHEDGIRACYPDSGSTAGIAKEMVERRREQQTLRSLDGMVRYLDGVREERKFVLLLSEGWVQFRRNDQLGRHGRAAAVPRGQYRRSAREASAAQLVRGPRGPSERARLHALPPRAGRHGASDPADLPGGHAARAVSGLRPRSPRA
jgi:hypothetical protein